ncbi:uncharacterized protein LOC110859556 isoform X1 [Folsomia candida]|uniref:uncharacterized protein LOC110859556 isoform X1 n=1 Tax=Folsomia candida TaxID=158441 RepID=UPI000B8F567D|nr:uncharacterized protein LOC110859556 isoform X1 [Folsomia candida]
MASGNFNMVKVTLLGVLLVGVFIQASHGMDDQVINRPVVPYPTTRKAVVMQDIANNLGPDKPESSGVGDQIINRPVVPYPTTRKAMVVNFGLDNAQEVGQVEEILQIDKRPVVPRPTTRKVPQF